MLRRFGIAGLIQVLVVVGLPLLPHRLTPGSLEDAAAAPETSTVRASLASSGEQGNGFSSIPSVSGNGRYVAFRSSATNLVPGDGNGVDDVFVRDTVAGTTTRVSVSSAGAEGNGFSSVPAISRNSRYVAFESSATNLVSGDTNGRADIFLHDLSNRSTILVSVTSTGGQPNDASHTPSLTADGQQVVFSTYATNVVPNDTNNTSDVFLRDLVTGQTTRISLSSSGEQGSDYSKSPSIAADGRYVAFASKASNLVAGDTNNTRDVFVRDLATVQTERVSVTSAETEDNNHSNLHSATSISDDGRYVGFSSDGNLVGQPVNAWADIYLRDRSMGTTSLVTFGYNGEPANDIGAPFGPSLSRSGRFLAFMSYSSNLVPADNGGDWDVFVHDALTRQTTLASVNSAGQQGNNPSDSPSISSSGRMVAFESTATNLVSDDTNAAGDVFVRDRGVAVAVSAEQTWGLGDGLHGPYTGGFQNDPVSSATGSFVHSVTDASLPGIGLPFAFLRAYNSGDTSDGPVGVGWTHSYAVALATLPDGDVTFKAEDGQRLTFDLQPDGSFKGLPGVRSTLERAGTDYRLARMDQVVYTFDANGRLTRLQDRNGNRLTFSYTRGRLTSITDTVNRSITLTYNSADRITAVTLPDNRSVSFTYSAGLLASATDLRGKITTYTYDASKRLIKVVDPLQHAVVENTYGSDGRITQQKDALGNISTFSWDAAAETSTMTDARGNQWKDVYSGNVLIRQIDPLGNVTRFDRDDDLNLISVTDPRNNSVSMTYDSRGNLLTWTAPAPFFYEARYTYNSRNDLMSMKDDRGLTTTYDYDGAGNLTKITRPGTVVTQFGRDASGNGLLRGITDPRGKVTSFDYDSSGNLTKVTTPLGFKTTMGYDSSGRRTSLVEPRGNVLGADPLQYQWTFTYGAADNLRTRTDPLGNVTEWTYDDAGNLATVKDAKNRVTQYGYNAANELTSVTAPDPAIVTTYGYDQVGNLTSRTDDNLHTTTYGYNAANRLQTVTSPRGQLWSYEYDPSGNVKKVVTAVGNSTTDPADGTINYGYDNLNRLASIDYSDATPDVQLAYDANGNRSSMTDGAGTETYTYDNLDQLKTVTRDSDVFSYGYDPAGNVTRRTYPDGTVIDYTYDDDGRLKTVTADAVTTTYGYDEAGNLTSTTLPSGNGYVESRTYDQAGRLTAVTNTKGQSVLSSFTYTLDAVGNPEKAVTPTETATYSYDALDRITEVCFALSCPGAQDPYIRWTYDGVGNRLTETTPSGTTTYSYNAADQLTSATGPLGTTTYSYDANGNQTQAGNRSFGWNLANKLTSTQLGATTATYSYDGDGNRLQETTDRVVKFLWDPNFSLPQLALERNDAGSVLRRYVHGSDLLSLRTGGSTYYYHYDGLGSVANLTSSSGMPQWTYSYEPFGALRAEIKHVTSAPRNAMRFTGELFDTPTGLYYLRARQYRPSDGLFLSSDPLSRLYGSSYINAYAYVENRPTLKVDPSGLRGSRVIGIIGLPSLGPIEVPVDLPNLDIKPPQQEERPQQELISWTWCDPETGTWWVHVVGIDATGRAIDEIYDTGVPCDQDPGPVDP